MANRGEARAKLGRWRAISRTACSLFLAGFAVSSLSCGSDKGSSATPSSVPTAGAGTSLIAFETDRDGNDEIYIMDLTRRGLRIARRAMPIPSGRRMEGRLHFTHCVMAIERSTR